MLWSRYVAVGDSLTAGRDDAGPDGRRIGWPRRLTDLIEARTGVSCLLTNLARDGAGVSAVLRHQLPLVGPLGPDLVSVTAGMNDIRELGFRADEFAAGLGLLLDGLAGTGATVLTCTLPDIAAAISLPSELVEIARERMRQASEIIRKQAARRDAICLDVWAMPQAGDAALFGPDHIHPNSDGHRLIAASFAELLAHRSR